MGKTFKIQHIAVGAHEWDVWLLDSNGRLWSPDIVLSGGGPSEWVSDEAAGAVALTVDGRSSVWLINAEGQIFVWEASQGLGDIERHWVEISLQDDAGKFVKATQISAGVNTVVVVDDRKRIWQRWHAVPGATGSGWMLNKGASQVKSVAVGYGGNPLSEELYCLNESGKFYLLQEGNWSEQEAFEGVEGQAPKKLSSLSSARSLEMGRHTTGQFWYRNLFYLGTDGHIYEPGGMQAVAPVFYRDKVGIGVDFSVRDVNDIWMVNKDGAIYRRTNKTFTSPLVVGKPSPVTVQGDTYFWTNIKGPDFSQARIYWIQPGDTFNQLAKDLGTTPAALEARNEQITDIDKIKAGERLHLM